MDFTISRRLSSGHFYAYYKKRFWFWDSDRGVWTESHLMSQKYEREHSAKDTLTPEDFMSDLTKFLPLDDYELDAVMLDALKDVKPCKTVPIEPVKEESECTTMDPAAPSENADGSSAIGGAHSLTGTGSMTEPVHSAPPDKPLTFIPENKTPAFDYTGLDQQTVEDLRFAEDEYRHGKKLAERGLVHMGNAIAAAHDALCGVVQQLDNSKHGNRGDDSFRAWCCSIGITKSSAYNLLQVSALMDGSSPRQRAILEALPPTLLYAVAKPSAPQELVEKVKNGEVSSNKEYQALLKENQQLRTDRVNAMNQADREKARADRAVAEIGDRDKTIQSLLDRSEKADARAEAAESHYKAALADVTGLQEQYFQMSQRANDAEARAKTAEAALKKQPITTVVDEEEVDRRAHQQAYSIAADMTEELKTDRDKLQKDNAALQKQLAEAQAVPPIDLQDDIETADGCCINMEGLWNMARPAFTRLIGTGEDLNHAAESMISLCDRIRAEAVQFIIKNDKETLYE